MIRFVNEESGKTVMTEKDNGEVEFHIKEDKEKVKEEKEEKE